MVNCPTGISDFVSQSPALLDLFISSDTSICSIMAFLLFGNSDHVVVSVSIEFLSNSIEDPPFHCIACLGPTLFILHINDLPDNVICNIAIYAEDNTLNS